MEEWQAKSHQHFKANTGMTPTEWYIKKVESFKSIDYLKESRGAISEDDIKLVTELQALGLSDGVINVLLDYCTAVSRNGLVYPLVREMGNSWLVKNSMTIEKAILFAREEHEKNKY